MSYEFERMLPQQFRLTFGEELREWGPAIEEHKTHLKELSDQENRNKI